MYPIAYMLLGIFFLAVLFSVYEGYVYHKDLQKRLQDRRSEADEYRKKRNRQQ